MIPGTDRPRKTCSIAPTNRASARRQSRCPRNTTGNGVAKTLPVLRPRTQAPRPWWARNPQGPRAPAREVQPPRGRAPDVLGGRDRLVGWDLGVAVSQGFPRLAVDEGGRAAVGAGR